MEPIKGYDEWLTSTPEETLTNEDIDIIERNLKPCPFCGKRPCFELSEDEWFVVCECGGHIPGEDPVDASAKWATRPKVENFREGPRAFWQGG